MTQFVSYKQWMADTWLLTGSRNDLLKAVDKAYEAYDKAQSLDTREKLKEAFDRWAADRQRRGKPWRDSDRNKKGAITRLHAALNAMEKRLLSKEERAAMDHVVQAQAMALKAQFLGKAVAFKSNSILGLTNAASAWNKVKGSGELLVVDGGSLGHTAYSAGKSLAGVASDLKTLKSGGTSALNAAKKTEILALKPKILAFIKDLCPGLDPEEVFSKVGLGSVHAFAADLAPFLGTISSGGKALVGWSKCAKMAWDSHSLEQRRYVFRPGDPEAAFDAVLGLLDREIRDTAKKAGVHTTSMTGKLLASFADGGAVSGPVLGTLETLALIFLTVMDVARDYKEVKAANLCIERGALDLNLFTICPLLGCYFLLVQDHSTIINYAVGDYGRDGWMMDVEHLVKKVDVVLVRARQYVKVSRFEMPGMEGAKGIREADWSHKKGFDKVTSAPGAAASSVASSVSNKISAQIDKFRGKSPIPKVDRARIVGIGSAA